MVARGRLGPDPEADLELEMDGRTVVVPQAAPTPVGSHAEPAAPPAACAASSFHHNEFLVYREDQHRIRYVLLLDW